MSFFITQIQSQSLSGPITSIEKLQSSDHHILAMIDGYNYRVVGYIKYGTKNLFLYSKSGKVSEKRCMCILDFYIIRQMQRLGLGVQLFQKCLDVRRTSLCLDDFRIRLSDSCSLLYYIRCWK